LDRLLIASTLVIAFSVSLAAPSNHALAQPARAGVVETPVSPGPAPQAAALTAPHPPAAAPAYRTRIVVDASYWAGPDPRWSADYHKSTAMGGIAVVHQLTPVLELELQWRAFTGGVEYTNGALQVVEDRATGVGGPLLGAAYRHDTTAWTLRLGGAVVVPLPLTQEDWPAGALREVAIGMSGHRDLWLLTHDTLGLVAKASAQTKGDWYFRAELAGGVLIATDDRDGGAAAQLDLSGGRRFGPVLVGARLSNVVLADFSGCYEDGPCQWGSGYHVSLTPFVRVEHGPFIAAISVLINAGRTPNLWAAQLELGARF